MTMILWAVLTLTLTIQANQVGYTGMRTTIQKTALKSQKHESFKSAVLGLKDQSWASIFSNVTGALFMVNFTVEDINCTKAEYDVSKMTTEQMSVQDNQILFKQEGEMLNLEFTFSYDLKIFGMHLFFNTGSLTVKTTKLEILLGYKGQDISAWVYPKFSAPAVTVKGGLIFNSALAKWVGLVVEEKLYALIEAKLGAILSVREKAAMAKWFKIENKVSEDMIFVINNYVLDLQEKPEEFVSFGYKSIVNKKDAVYSKELHKKMNTSILMDGITSKMCMSTDMITAFYEIEGKTRTSGIVIDPKKIDFSGKALDLYYMMPKLREMYSPSDKLEIACVENGFYYNKNLVINLLNNASSKQNATFYYPLSCEFQIEGKNVLTVALFTRPVLSKIGSDAGSCLLKVDTSFWSNELYYHKLSYSVAPVNSDTLYGLSYKLMKIIEMSVTPIKEGISIPKPRIDATYTPEYRSFDEICFDGVEAQHLPI